MNAEDRDLLGVYALDAIDDPAEIERVETLLEASPEARAELARLREVTALLTPPDHDVPPQGWDGILEAIDVPAPPLDLDAIRRRREHRLRAPRRREHRLRAILIGAAACLVVLALVAGVLVGRWSDGADGGITAVAASAAARDDATVLALADDDGNDRADIVMLPDGTAYLRARDLDDLPAGSVYQLWALVGDADAPEAISAGVFGRDPDVAAFHFDGAVIGFALTVEDDPGVVSTDRPATAVGLVD